jgi:hypothetical protein
MKMLVDYQGKNVRLTDERAAHILQHPEMTNMSLALETTVREPQLVIRSSSDETANLNYRYYYGTKVGDKWLCVVVKYSSDDAFVLTAYLTDKPKRGVQLWPNK